LNGLYIGIGLTIILALLAALIGPFFVDWGSYRSVFEREASKIVGVPVTVLGDVDVRLLPSPRIRFADVAIGPVEAPVGRVGRFELDLEAAPLLRGDVRVSELRFERPALEIDVDRDGRILLPARSTEVREPASVAIDRVEIVDGRLTIADARGGGSRFEIGRIAAVGSAASLAGPWRLDGSGLMRGRELSFHLAGARSAEGATALKGQLATGDDPATLSADLLLRDGPAGPVISGKAIAERRVEAGEGLAAGLAQWRAEAEILADTRAIEATNLALALGPEERAAQFTGKGRIALGAEPGFELTLSARQIELDRLVRGAAGPAVVPATLAGEALARAAGLGGATLPGRIAVDIQGLVVGGGAVQDLTLEARPRPGGLTIDRFEARLPGRSRLETTGRLGFDGGGRYDGRLEASSEQPTALAAWWRAEAVGDRIDPVTVAATLSVAGDRLAADDLRLEVARARARGHFDWSAAGGARIGLTAERLELDQVARLARLFLGRDAARRPAALEVDLDAGQMVVGGITAKGVRIGARVAADDVAIERLAVQDLAGARLSGSGRIGDPLGAPRGSLDLTIDAPAPEAPARALALAAGAPAETVDRIAAFAAAAAPLDLAVRLEGHGAAGGAVASGSLRGFAGGAEITSDLAYEGRIDDPARALVRLGAKLAGDKAAPALARLFGAGGAASPVAVDVSISGRPAEGLAVAATARVGATAVAIEGTAATPVGAPARLDGRFRLATPDAAALGGIFGRPILAFERRLPVEISGLAGGTWPRLELGEVTGRVGETALRGSGRIDLGSTPAKFDGRLDLDRLDLETVAEAVFGGAILADGSDPAAIWATTPLYGASFDGAITGTAQVSVGRASLGEVGFERLRCRVVTAPGEVRLEAIDAGFAGGGLGGEMVIRRGGDGVTGLSGRAALDRVRLADVVWRRGGRPIAGGRLDGDLSFTSAGRTAAALVAGLGGEGRVRLSDVRVSGLGGEAFAAARKALGEAAPTAVTAEAALRTALAASETDLPPTDLAFALQAGVARSGRQVIETGSVRLTGRVVVDLSRATLDAETTVEPAGEAIQATRTAISRATPSVGLAFRGPITAPRQSLDVAPLVAHLTLAGFEREIERVETLQQDIAERARFARERRRAEQRAAAEEAARREAEARRLAEDEARRAAAAKPAEPAKPVEPARPTAAGASAVPIGEAAAVPAAGSGASGTGSLPPLPPPIVVAPAPPVGEAGGRPLTIVPPSMGTP